MHSHSSPDLEGLLELGNLGIRLSNQQKYSFSKFILLNVCQKLHALQSPQLGYFLKVAESCKAQMAT